MGPNGLSGTQNAKISFIYSPNSVIDDQFTLYIDNLKPLTKRWKDLVKMEDEQWVSATLMPPLTHQTIISLLKDPLPCISHILTGSTNAYHTWCFRYCNKVFPLVMQEVRVQEGLFCNKFLRLRVARQRALEASSRWP
ncbi:hypothetical protein HYDPIDRAFT_26202 [Hydnomerulius pinastri MD-312]|nr:hypothetical protein HYDPIDRAFT_26202 [Hydnomerulius pinastri MD-312]